MQASPDRQCTVGHVTRSLMLLCKGPLHSVGGGSSGATVFSTDSHIQDCAAARCFSNSASFSRVAWIASVVPPSTLDRTSCCEGACQHSSGSQPAGW